MKLKHKSMVIFVYPNAVCIHDRTSGDQHGDYIVYTDVYGKGRKIGEAPSAWGAWADAYRGFNKANRAKIPMALMEGR